MTSATTMEMTQVPIGSRMGTPEQNKSEEVPTYLINANIYLVNVVTTQVHNEITNYISHVMHVTI